ncbi:MAG: AraC family transcriptional regulator [Cyanobacteria bacterium P01_G01_bin.49]
MRQPAIHISEDFARRSVTPECLLKVGEVDVYRVIQPPSEFSDALTQHMLCVLLNTNWKDFRQISRFAGEEYDGCFSPFDFLLLPAFTPAFFAWNKTDESIIFTIEPNTLERVAIENDCLSPSRVELKPIIYDQDPKLDFFTRLFYEEITQKAVGTKLFTESIANLFLIHLLRNYCTFTPKLRQERSGLSPRKLQQAVTYIQDNLAEDISLQAIATEVNMSRYYFCRLFKKSTGITPHQYLIKSRIERAQELLSRKHQSIADVSLQVGFANQSHFTKHFKRLVGITPKQFSDS